jgi:hypothetical protein
LYQERKIIQQPKFEQDISFAKVCVCVLLCVSDFWIQSKDALIEESTDAGDGGSSAYHDCADATAANAATDDDDTAITRLTRHIRVFGTTELL